MKKGPVEKHVVTCFLEHHGKILILKRSQKVGTHRGVWAGVSGYVETVCDRQALVEIQEETGLLPVDMELVKAWNILTIEDGAIRWMVHPYLFHIREKPGIKIDWEHTDFKWIKPQEI
ncbi:MAG: NUDIX domain-containing protein, partial [Dehalococcoidales bacterium]|nr:NUDIX domain-containing protein [Dehalococcoidales bacterium]